MNPHNFDPRAHQDSAHPIRIFPGEREGRPAITRELAGRRDQLDDDRVRAKDLLSPERSGSWCGIGRQCTHLSPTTFRIATTAISSSSCVMKSPGGIRTVPAENVPIVRWPAGAKWTPTRHRTPCSSSRRRPNPDTCRSATVSETTAMRRPGACRSVQANTGDVLQTVEEPRGQRDLAGPDALHASVQDGAGARPESGDPHPVRGGPFELARKLLGLLFRLGSPARPPTDERGDSRGVHAVSEHQSPRPSRAAQLLIPCERLEIDPIAWTSISAAPAVCAVSTIRGASAGRAISTCACSARRSAATR